MTNDPLPEIRRLGVVPVLVIDDPGKAGRVAQALAEGGLPLAEIAFRTPAAAEAIRRIAAERPDVLLGAGSVRTPEQAREAKEGGARFVVSPGFSPRVVEYCKTHDLLMIPGMCTPTEIEMGLSAGLSVLKFFPAEAIGGLTYLEAIAAPYEGVEFIPTGGINASHLTRYLRFSQVLACGGSWMAPEAWIEAEAYDRIREAARLAIQAVAGARGARSP